MPGAVQVLDEVRFQELYTWDATDGDDSDGYVLDGDLLDLEPALRDALVLELPLSPLCADDCLGLCAQCGVRLADAGRPVTGTRRTGRCGRHRRTFASASRS